MDNLGIDYFLEVANNLSFSQTAEKFYVSQPAVSKQIKALELRLGCTLFKRTNKGVCLTESGNLFLLSSLNIVMRCMSKFSWRNDLKAKQLLVFSWVSRKGGIPVTFA